MTEYIVIGYRNGSYYSAGFESISRERADLDFEGRIALSEKHGGGWYDYEIKDVSPVPSEKIGTRFITIGGERPMLYHIIEISEGIFEETYMFGTDTTGKKTRNAEHKMLILPRRRGTEYKMLEEYTDPDDCRVCMFIQSVEKDGKTSYRVFESEVSQNGYGSSSIRCYETFEEAKQFADGRRQKISSEGNIRRRCESK